MISIDVVNNLSDSVSNLVSPTWPGNYWAHWAIFTVIIVLFTLLMVMGFIYFERRFIGWIQIRPGPNRVGPFGLLQPVADAIKVLIKEDIVPAKGDKIVHFLAPIIAFLPVMLILAVVPIYGGTGLVPDLNIGLLFAVAIASLSVLGVFMAGWSSNNKYSLISAMRTVAQMVSYELPLVLSILGVVMVAGSLSLNTIVEKQTVPFILLQPLSFLIYFLSSLAELNRAPFDLLEAESEMVAGYQTEYSGMKFALFYLAEYGHSVVFSAICATLFLSGWKGPFLPPILWLLIKMIAIFAVIVWIRGTVPRFRVDQLMGFAWKCLLPMSILNLFIIGIEIFIWPNFPWPLLFVNFAAAGVLIVLWSKLFKLGGGRVEV